METLIRNAGWFLATWPDQIILLAPAGCIVILAVVLVWQLVQATSAA